MKKIIEGKLYDTGTATLVASKEFVGNYEEYQLIEDLYQKSTGEFFIARDFWGYDDEDNYNRMKWVIDHILEPLSVDEAKLWCEEHADTDTYIDLFGKPEE